MNYSDLLNQINLETVTLYIGAFIAFYILAQWHFSKDNTFDLKSSISDEGKFSLSKFGQLTALVLSSWVLVYQTRHNALTEWLFMSYISTWAVANGFSKYLETKKPPSESK